MVHVKMENGTAISDSNLFSYIGPGETSSNWYRPVGMHVYYLLLSLLLIFLIVIIIIVGLDWGKCDGLDCLLITDDAQGTVISVTFTSNCNWYIINYFSFFYSYLLLAVIRVYLQRQTP